MSKKVTIKKSGKKNIFFKLILMIATLVLLFLALPLIASFLSEYWWWKSLGFLSVWIKQILFRVLAFVIPFFSAFLIQSLWFFVLRRQFKRNFLLPLNLLISTLMGFFGTTLWKYFITNLTGAETGYHDPIFHLDAYFYMFRLPLIRLFLIQVMIFFAILFVLDLFIDRKKKLFQNGKIHLDFSANTLLILNVFLFLLFEFIGILELLVIQPESKIGIGYSTLHGTITGLFVWMGILVLLTLWLVVGAVRTIKPTKILLIFFLAVFSWFLSVQVYPGFVYQFYVKPNQLMVQKPFIQNRMKATRAGFNLHFEEADTMHSNQNNPLERLRIWDPDPYLKVIRQVQEVKSYFEFIDVDVDQYRISNQLQQVLLSTRELNVNRLPDSTKTWDNVHLRYTHGYGLTLSPANQVTNSGSPVFTVRDLENHSDFPEFAIKRPQIYFGELTSNYIVVQTTADEFEYSSDTNRITTRYTEKKGVLLNSFLRRWVFSTVFKERKLLFTRYLTKNSRILYRRQIIERVKHVFPYLKYDPDPYLTILNGQLYWMIDAYTVSDRFPLAERFPSPFGTLNYIRNSVKVLINAYTGDLSYQIVDPNDPILQAYVRIFPTLFSKTVPKQAKYHYRYPTTLFSLQSKVICTYHVNNTESFYNGEDAWKIPEQIYGDTNKIFTPYYIINSINGKETFSLIQPFTPVSKENLSGWLIAYYDKQPHLNLHYIDRSSSSLGPMQVESRINQDETMSRLFSLWGQMGSKVFRGNIQFIPYGKNLIYAESIFLESEQTSIPQLVQVLAIAKSKVYRGATTAKLIANMQSDSQTVSLESIASLDSLSALKLAYKLYLNAEQDRIAGDLNAYQKNVDKLGEVLRTSAKLKNEH